MAGYQINPDSNLDKKMRSVQFFNLYFSKFRYIVLTNLLFFVPVLLAAAYVAGTYFLFNGINIFAAAVSIIILNPFMAGVALVCRYIYTGREFSVAKTFIKGVRENWAKCLIHGIICYIVFVVSYFSLSLYFSGTKTSLIFWVPLGITALIVIFVLFSSYYANIMTVTMDIKLKDLYRNCMLFSFGELKNNLFTTLALIFFAAVVFTLLVFFKNPVLVIAIGGLLIMLIIPSTVQYIITFYVYDSMVAILDENKKKEEKEKAENPVARVNVNKDEAKEISRLAPEGKDEYIFHNGKMIKRSLIEQQVSEKIEDDFD